MALVAACAASGGSESDDTSGNGSDSGSQGIDGGPVLYDGAVPDGGTYEGGSADGGCPATENACRIFPNCGCGGNTCDFPIDGGPDVFCEADSGVATAGESCTTTEDCIGGETCLFSKCRPYCGTLGTSCGNPKLSLCRAHAAYPGDYVCGIQCDLTSATSCNPAPGGCVVLAAGATAYTTECEPVGVAGVGATCTTTNDCAPSLVCIVLGAAQTCQQRCTPTGVKGSCTTGICTAESPPLTIGGVDYGYCQ